MLLAYQRGWILDKPKRNYYIRLSLTHCECQLEEGGETMQLVRFDPFRTLLNDDFVTPSSQYGLRVNETEYSIIVRAVVAGVPKKNVEIEIEDGVLTIKAEVKDEKENKSGHTVSSYQYYYTTALSGGQWDKAEAVVEDGVVKIEIPKTEASRPRKITVKSK